jgi:hypothetical protein
MDVMKACMKGNDFPTEGLMMLGKMRWVVQKERFKASKIEPSICSFFKRKEPDSDAEKGG